jgi:hypothetical protein
MSCVRENYRPAPRSAPWPPFILAVNIEDAVTNSKGETIQLFKITKQGAGFRLLEKLGTDPYVYYLPSANRKYPAPGEPKSWEKKA